MLYLAIKNELIKMLNSMPANSRVPSRSQICMKWKISRRTADKIIAELQKEGIVYSVKGSGTFTILPDNPEVVSPKVITRRRHWAIVIPDVRYSEQPEAFDGIMSFTNAHSIDLTICNTDENPDIEYAVIQRQIALGVDGIILIPAITTTENIRNYKYVIKTGTPFVFWQRSVDYMTNVPQILLNGYYGGYIATKHLLDMGYNNIMFIGTKRFRSSMDRYMGCCAAISETGQRIKPKMTKIGIEFDLIRSFVFEKLKSDDPPDGFVCYVDNVAYEVIKGIKDAGAVISDDVGVICFEGSKRMAECESNIELTYVDINRFESGKKAAETLWEMMMDRDHEVLTYVISPTLQIRYSCLGKKKGGINE